jgi:hypothetical protein
VNLIELNPSLTRPTCPQCGIGRICPADVWDGQYLTFECPFPYCSWKGYAPLPAIRKTLIYLDTSIISNMANALRKGQFGSPWLRLYKVLCQATADEVICCPISADVYAEVELFSFAEEIIRLSWDFADPGVLEQTMIREAQLSRALDRFLKNEPPKLETDLPPTDAFRENVHTWLPNFRVDVRLPSPPRLVSSIRSTKEWNQRDLARIYGEYTKAGHNFDKIRRAEARGYGRGLLRFGQRALRRRWSIEPVPLEDPSGHLWRTDYDIIADRIAQHEGLNYPQSLRRAAEFLESDHVCLTPIADLQSRLHAALERESSRRRTPRPPTPSDAFDIDHIAIYMPYVDIFTTDTFMADQCNRRDMQLGAPYNTKIRSLKPGEIDEFIAEIENLSLSAPQVELARRIASVMYESGHPQE